MRERYDRSYRRDAPDGGRREHRNAAAYGGFAPALPFGGWFGEGYPTSPFLMGAPAYPLGFGWGGVPTPMGGRPMYDRDFRRPPEESPTYGRGGDRAARGYLRERGYDAGYAIRPHPSGRRGYGRDFGR